MSGVSFPFSNSRPVSAYPSSPKTKSLWTHAIDRLNSRDGFFDAMKLGQITTEWLKISPQLSSHQTRLTQAHGVFFAAATLANTPDLVKCAGDTLQSLSLIGRAANRTNARTSQDQTTSSLFKRIMRNLLDLTCMSSDTANNFHELGWINLGKAAPVSSGIFFGTDIIGNGLDLTTQVLNVRSRFLERQRTPSISPERVRFFERKDVLSYIEIFKNSVCIVGSTLGLASLCVGGAVVLPVVGVAISSLWIVSKITSHFYEAISVKESRASLRIRM